MKTRNVKIMGVLNVTPDSFSDGGKYFDVKKAVERGLQMEKEGADIIDIGGESSGPGSEYVSVKEELRRVAPVIEKLKKLLKRSEISIDTYKFEVAEKAFKAGATILNDVTALRGDKKLTSLAAKANVKVVLMYSKDPSARTTRKDIKYADVIETVERFLAERINYALRNGIKKKNIIIDPGMGAFISGLSEYSYEVIRRLAELKKLGRPILIGVSNKSFLPGKINERLLPTLLSNLAAIYNGASIIRVHDVKCHRRLVNALT